MQRKSWKIFADSLEKSNTSKQKKSSTKYKPKMGLNKSNDSFHFSKQNSSFSKLNSTFNNNQSTFPTFPRNSSQGKLLTQRKTDDFTHLKVPPKKKDENQNAKTNLKNYNEKVFVLKNQRALAEVQRLKSEFNQFKKTIMKKLVEQEKLIETLISNAFQNYSKNQVQIKQRKSMQITKLDLPSDLEYNSQIQKETFPVKKMQSLQLAENKTDREHNSQQNKNNNHQFNRFLNAIERLRTDLNELGSLSEISSLCSPRDHKDTRWESNKKNGHI